MSVFFLLKGNDALFFTVVIKFLPPWWWHFSNCYCQQYSLASTMPFSTGNRCQNKSLNWCRVCVFSNTEVTKIGISKSKTGIRINISTIKCLGSGHIFRVGRGTGNTLLIYLRLSTKRTNGRGILNCLNCQKMHLRS